MYALKCSVNGEIFKAIFDKSDLPTYITFQEGNASCGFIMVNPNNENEINIGGIDVNGGIALADGTIYEGTVREGMVFTEESITIEFLPYETNGDVLNSGDKDVYYLISTHILPKSIISCASFDMPPPPPGM